MSYAEEFRTVELIIETDSQTKYVDAFCLSLIKSERQMRKLVTHLIYQTLLPAEHSKFIEVLAKERVYFSGLMKGFDALSPTSTKDIQGVRFSHLYESLSVSKLYRNKIFHGQLTGQCLDENKLLEKINDIKEWCSNLSIKCNEIYGFDGFGRNSLQKNHLINEEHLKIKIKTLIEYKKFIKEIMI